MADKTRCEIRFTKCPCLRITGAGEIRKNVDIEQIFVYFIPWDRMARYHYVYVLKSQKEGKGIISRGEPESDGQQEGISCVDGNGGL